MQSLIKEIPKEFYRNGFFHYRMQREGNVCMYVEIDDPTTDDNHHHYEVVKITKYKLNRDNLFHKRLIEMGYDEVEKYPSDNQWGELGWTFTEEWRAKNKYNELVKHRRV